MSFTARDIKEKTQVVKLPERSKNIETDYRYARENLYNIIEKGSDALNTLVDVANQSQREN